MYREMYHLDVVRGTSQSMPKPADQRLKKWTGLRCTTMYHLAATYA
jgi:hypothetical protein